MAPTPLALSPALPSELLTNVLARHNQPTILLICQPRTAFMASLVNCVPQTMPREPQPAPSPPLPPCVAAKSKLNPESKPKSETELASPGPQSAQRHPLLVPTLDQVAKSRHIDVVFMPTVAHLRAHLMVLLSTPPQTVDHDAVAGEGVESHSGKSFLVVYGLIELHRHTSEWSVQGLGNTLAALVETAWSAGKAVELVEEWRGDGREDQAMLDHGLINAQPALSRQMVWEERLPMLNGNSRRPRLEGEDGGWSGRTVEVGRILARWFKFDNRSWQI